MAKTDCYNTALKKEMQTGVAAQTQGKWIKVHGHEVLHKRVGTPEEIYHTNIYKALLKNPPVRFGIESTLKAINATGNKTMGMHKPNNWNEMTIATNWLNAVITSMLYKLGLDKDVVSDFGMNTAMVVEFDQAYRFRMQDMMGQTTVEAMTKNPSKELERLLMINRVRDRSVGDKISYYGKVLVWLLKIPTYKKAFIYSIKLNGVKHAQFDENDKYWAALKTDYHYHV